MPPQFKAAASMSQAYLDSLQQTEEQVAEKSNSKQKIPESKIQHKPHTVKRSSLVIKQEKPKHPYRHLIFSSKLPDAVFFKYLALIYRGLAYSTKFLKEPSEK